MSIDLGDGWKIEFLGTPGRPAPDRAWSVTTWTSRTPKASASGLSAMTRPMVEQLGLVTIAPPP